MELQLERADLLQLDPISNTDTLKLLSVGKKNKQKLVVGDDSGTVSCFEFKKGEPQSVFQSRPFEGPVSCIALGGTRSKRDRIFASHGQRIVGLDKKGYEFFKLTSQLIEPIRNIAVEDTRIWTGCEYVFNVYDNGQDSAFYMSRDQINGLFVDNLYRDRDYDAVLACQDSCIRIIHGSECALEIPTTSAVTSVALLSPSDSKLRKGRILYGMESGSLGAVEILSNGDIANNWILDDNAKRSTITCVKVFDITKDGYNDLIVGRDDGRLEVYNQEDGAGSMPQLSFSTNIGESIRSTECGLINSSDYNDVVIAAYSGKILGFTSEPVLQRAQEDSYGRSVKTVNNENRVKYMKKELGELRKKVEKEREKFKKSGNSGGGITSSFSLSSSSKGSSSSSAPSFSNVALDFPINVKFILDAELAAYVLTIEIQSAMDLVIIRSPIMLDLVDSEIGTSVVSITPPHLLATAAASTQGASSSSSSGNNNSNSNTDPQHKFVAAFRCQGQERRMSITLRSTEGCGFGDLLVTVVTASTPKAAKVVKFPLKPLSLHCRVHEFTEEERRRPRNRVRFVGNASINTVHEWVQAILPDVPPRLPEEITECIYLFKNTYTGSTTTCRFNRDELVIESESASTIAIVKENITRLANYRRINLDETITNNNDSISSFLSLIQAKVEYQLSLTRKMELLDSLQEITIQETDISWLQPEYSNILSNSELIRKEFKLRTKTLEYLSGIITDLFVDWSRLNGIDGRNKLLQLQNTILTLSFDKVIEMFLMKKK